MNQFLRKLPGRFDILSVFIFLRGMRDLLHISLTEIGALVSLAKFQGNYRLKS